MAPKSSLELTRRKKELIELARPIKIRIVRAIYKDGKPPLNICLLALMQAMMDVAVIIGGMSEAWARRRLSSMFEVEEEEEEEEELHPLH